MLPQFPKSEKILREYWLELVVQKRNATSPMLASIPHRMQREGKEYSFKTVQGTPEKMDYELLSFNVSIPMNKEHRGLTLMEFQANAADLGEKFAHAMSKKLIGELDAATEKTGNVVNLKGEPLRPEHLLEIVEKTEVDFKESGEPADGFIYLNPADYERAIKHLGSLKEDPELRKRADEQMRRKKEQFREREARRRLVE